MRKLLKRAGWWRTDDGRWFRHCKEDGSQRGILQSVEFSWKRGEFGPNVGVYWDGCDYNDGKKLYVGFLIGRVWLGFGDSRKGSRYGFDIGRKLCYFWWNVRDADTNAEGGKHIVFFWHRITDAILGRADCFTENQEWKRKKCVIPMPEGDYPAVASFERRVWVRKRSPFHRVRLDTSIDIPVGIPFSGKGENSWDMGEDALYGTGCGGHDLQKAIEAVQKSVMDYRKRRGDPEKWPMPAEERVKAYDQAKAEGGS